MSAIDPKRTFICVTKSLPTGKNDLSLNFNPTCQYFYFRINIKFPGILNIEIFSNRF